MEDTKVLLLAIISELLFLRRKVVLLLRLLGCAHSEIENYPQHPAPNIACARGSGQSTLVLARLYDCDRTRLQRRAILMLCNCTDKSHDHGQDACDRPADEIRKPLCTKCHEQNAARQMGQILENQADSYERAPQSSPRVTSEMVGQTQGPGTS